MELHKPERQFSIRLILSVPALGAFVVITIAANLIVDIYLYYGPWTLVNFAFQMATHEGDRIQNASLANQLLRGGDRIH